LRDAIQRKGGQVAIAPTQVIAANEEDLAGFPGTAGVAAKHLRTGEEIRIDADQITATVSTSIPYGTGGTDSLALRAAIPSPADVVGLSR
jgi:hypothetical protein